VWAKEQDAVKNLAFGAALLILALCELTGRSPAEPTASEVQHAIAVGDPAALQRYTREFGPAFLNLNDDPHELTALHYAKAAGQVAAQAMLGAPSR
jgi:hypothetical protein